MLLYKQSVLISINLIVSSSILPFLIQRKLYLKVSVSTKHTYVGKQRREYCALSRSIHFYVLLQMHFEATHSEDNYSCSSVSHSSPPLGKDCKTERWNNYSVCNFEAKFLHKTPNLTQPIYNSMRENRNAHRKMQETEIRI